MRHTKRCFPKYREIRVSSFDLRISRVSLLMSQFVRDCVRQGDPIVLVDAAAAVRLAHASNVRHSQGTARSIRARTNVFSRHQNRHVVMIRVRVVGGI